MGTLFSSFPILVGELANHAFLREFSVFISCFEPSIFVVLLSFVITLVWLHYASIVLRSLL